MSAPVEKRHRQTATEVGMKRPSLTGNWLLGYEQALADQEAAPVPVVLHCPACHEQHVDGGEWATKPHRTHRCELCANEWRPSERNTVGVAQVDGDPPTFRRNPSSPRDCLNCHRPEGEHVWRCVGCDELLGRGDGLPSLHPHHHGHGPGHATLFCHWVELATEEGDGG